MYNRLLVRKKELNVLMEEINMDKKVQELLKEYEKQVKQENVETCENAHCCGLSDRQCANICCLSMCTTCCDSICHS